MKKILLGLVFFSAFAHAQNGLEGIIVEKYYISNANDATANSTDGILPVGSVTYRIYADMLPGYRFQAGFGVPTHEVKIATSTTFFNNEDRGAVSPTYTKTQAKGNTVMLDSWFSAGAACAGNFGILKTSDDGVATVVNSDGLLQNNDANAGIPLTTQDGMIAISGRNPEPLTIVGITTEAAMFDNQNSTTNGQTFSTTNGSWAALNGAVGPDSATNQVLIGQFTTDGNFTFELNIQIGTPSGGTEQYVAKNPTGAEISIPSLKFDSSILTNFKEQAESTSSFDVYPNPTVDGFTLSIANAEKNTSNIYTVYDAKGSVLYQKNVGKISSKQYKERVDISSYEKGLYFIVVSSDGVISTKKIIKN